MPKATLVLRSGDHIEFSKDPLMQKKVENILDGVEWTVKHQIAELPDRNMRTVVEFMGDMMTGENPRPNTKRAYITNLVLLSRYYNHKKSFNEFTRDEILTYLQSHRRTPAADIKERWINTYNAKTMLLSKFFKWLYFPELDRNQRKKAKPEVIKDLPIFRRKEKTSIEAKDLWLAEEDRVFLKYCPDARIGVYHTMADDTSGRPHELLAKRFGDVKIKNYNGRIYGEVEIGRGGKTKSRTVPLITSIPYFKQLQAENSDPNAFIFRAHSQSALFKNRPLTVHALGRTYNRMKEYFKTLLDRPEVPPEDKQIIKNMLEKPWNPYIRRHSSLTEKARLLKNDYSLRLHAGWTKNSKMIEIYTHELGGESSQELLAAYGVMPRSIDGKSDLLKPVECPNCREPNKPDARFCANVKCQMPLKFDAFQELKEKEAVKDKQLESQDQKINEIYKALYEKGIIRDPKKS